MSDIIRAHMHSSVHRTELNASSICGCFYCLSTFAPTKVTEWVDYPPDTPEEKEAELGTTALCPHCGVDSVIGDASGFPITKEFLTQMKSYWFSLS